MKLLNSSNAIIQLDINKHSLDDGDKNMNLDVENLQPTWRLWGEEKVEGALFNIFLKKVRYHRPAKSISSDSDDDISHLEWETVKVRFIKAGTLEKLVECLATDDGEVESTYINIFLATYRTFATMKQVLDLLLNRYEQLLNNEFDLPESVTEQHQKTLILVLHVWLDTYSDDFKDPPLHPHLHDLLCFAQHHFPESELYAKIQHKWDKFNKIDGMMESCSLYHGSLCIQSNGNNLGNLIVYEFPHVPERHFAQQLTRKDTELFKKLMPHQCLGAIWSRRGEKSHSHEAATVIATVNQFNAVSLRVISTVLMETQELRAAVITTWIHIAQELRVLKNFSSLKAIISGLQSHPVHRLQKTWSQLSKEKHEMFEELARIFCEDNNQWTQRELLMREGTAKFADTVGENDKHLQKVISRQHHCGNISHGTIPYLGTFLTDLTMIDTAIPDTLPDGLINFDKKRKEFEVLAQIKLLQGAANAYSLSPDEAFDRWFDSVLTLDDREANALSCNIEPSTNQSTIQRKGKKLVDSNRLGLLAASNSRKGDLSTTSSGHRKNDSIASTSSQSSSSSQFYYEVDSVPSSQHTTGGDSTTHTSHLTKLLSDSSSSTSSLPSLDASTSSSASHTVPSSQLPAPPSRPQSPGYYIIRVTMETDSHETEGVVMYKSIMLSNSERTPQVIQNAMNKLDIEGSADEWTLSQILPDKEMVLPYNANVYYAMIRTHDFNFILRRKRDSAVGTPDKWRTIKTSMMISPNQALHS
uniref:Ral guanine nucleotide dissociation stimulator-like 1 n=1 Tax=Cacopsylla melanoneura TaxID=428564 RepID=A0A8D8LI68_9HEMI